MSVTAWRIIKRKYIDSAFDGSGARKYGGRWNSVGAAIVYTAESQSLAVLEMLVHLDRPALLHSYILIPVKIAEPLIEHLDLASLPANWRDSPAPPQVKDIGDQWVKAGASVALQVPSVLLPAENNFLLNPNHPDFKKLIIGEPVDFRFDSRLAK